MLYKYKDIGMTIVYRHKVSVVAILLLGGFSFALASTGELAEPSGALAVAGLKKHGLKGKTVVAVVSGANVNFDRLRHISERTEVGERRVHRREHLTKGGDHATPHDRVDEHEGNSHRLLHQVAVRRHDVAIADGGDRHHRPVQACDVEVRGRKAHPAVLPARRGHEVGNGQGQRVRGVERIERTRPSRTDDARSRANEWERR